jgi:hypothetical protein
MAELRRIVSRRRSALSDEPASQIEFHGSAFKPLLPRRSLYLAFEP